MQVIFPQMLDPELVGRSPVERTELRYRTDVCLLGARRQIAHRHVVDHALALGSCRLDCTNVQSSQTGRLLPMIQLRLRRRTDQKESSDEGFSQNHQNPPFSI